MLLYNNPGRVGYTLSANLVERLAHEVPNIVGMKDTSGDITPHLLSYPEKQRHWIQGIRRKGYPAVCFSVPRSGRRCLHCGKFYA